jgi:hypothetical protein
VLLTNIDVASNPGAVPGHISEGKVTAVHAQLNSLIKYSLRHDSVHRELFTLLHVEASATVSFAWASRWNSFYFITIK